MELRIEISLQHLAMRAHSDFTNATQEGREVSWPRETHLCDGVVVGLDELINTPENA